ncbi:MAG TPA: hypothetical protein VHL08_07955 [Dongiaceae bacterium]|jgi:hypothetical protein|nr:hypothetical protein [Dongiaceae bacterium]
MRLFSALVLVLGCSGCAAGIYGAVESVTPASSKKTASDHLVSFITGDDCSLLRYQQTGHYCLSPAELAQARAQERHGQPICYRHLGDITCYDRIIPGATTRVQ